MRERAALDAPVHQRRDEEQAERVIEDFGFGDAVLHVIDGVADDERQENLNDVIEDDRYPTPGEILPISPEVGNERSKFFKHIESS